MAIELVITDETPEAEQQLGLSEEELLDCFLGAPLDGSYRQYLVRAAREIERKAREQMPKADLLAAADYLVPGPDGTSSMSGAEADRIASVLRGLAA